MGKQRKFISSESCGLKADCNTALSTTSNHIGATGQFHRLAFLEALFAAPALLNDLALSFFMRALSALDICSMSCCISFTRARNTVQFKSAVLLLLLERRKAPALMFELLQ